MFPPPPRRVLLCIDDCLHLLRLGETLVSIPIALRLAGATIPAYGDQNHRSKLHL
jgi:hypothetical protein